MDPTANDRSGEDGTEVEDRGIHDGYLVAGLLLVVVAVLAGALVGGGTAWRGALGLLGAGAALFAARRILERGRSPTDRVVLPDVETTVAAPVPGAGFDRTLATFEDGGEEYLAYPDRIRQALENAAVEVLGRYRGLPVDEARRLLVAGEWTDEGAAAEFLGGGDGSTPASGTVERLRRLVGRESAFHRGARSAVTEVAALAGIESDVDDGTTGGTDRDTALDGRPSTTASVVPSTDSADGTLPSATGRWTAVGAVGLFCGGLGVVGNWPAVVLAGTVGIGVAAYARAVPAPRASLSVERSVSATDPRPGETVAVTTTVRNVGDRTVTDLRLVDGVPAALPVVSGSPRAGGTLRPGESVELTYALRARRGVHRFDPCLAVVTDLAGTAERAIAVPETGDVDTPGANRTGASTDGGTSRDASEESAPSRRPAGGETRTERGASSGSTTVTCRPPLSSAVPTPIDGSAASYAGRVAATVAGEGIEFHAVRDYQRSDPIGRIDWNRYARTRDLAAREFRDERATRAVVVVDARRAAYLASAPDRPHAVDRGVRAARRAFAGLEDEGNRVGIAAFGRDPCWLRPGTGSAHRARARELLAAHPTLSSVPPSGTGGGDVERQFEWLRSRLPDDAQVVFVSPVCDDGAAQVVRRLRARGYPVTVLSPDPTADGSPERLLARVGRRLRLARLRDAGAVVVDWAEGEPLAAALER